MSRLLPLLKDAFWLIVAVGLVVGGVLGFQQLGAMRTPVTAAPAERPVSLVDAAALVPFDGVLPIRGEGFITPARQVSLAAQVSGRITALHPALDTRGRFAKGDVLVRLDDRAARASLDQTRANIASTQAKLDLNATQLARAETLRARGVIAQDQLDQLESQKAELTATLESLRAAEVSAGIALGYTEILAPFDGAVLDKVADLGAVVSPGQAIATLYTIDALEVTVPVSQADAAKIPGLFDGTLARAQVQAQFAGRVLVWDAQVVRVGGALDDKTRTIDVTLGLIGAPRLADGAAPVSGAPGGLVNTFAEAVIDGDRAEGAYVIPSTAYRDGGRVYLYRDGLLEIAKAERLHVDGESSFVRLFDVSKGALLITSPLDTVVAGMPLRRTGTDIATAE